MKTAKPDMGLAAELLYGSVQETESKVSNPADLNKLIGLPSLGNHRRDARNLAMLLATFTSGMDTYLEVFEGLQAKYGHDFKRLYFNEVHRYG